MPRRRWSGASTKIRRLLELTAEARYQQQLQRYTKRTNAVVRSLPTCCSRPPRNPAEGWGRSKDGKYRAKWGLDERL
jgi:hypothetical protein